MFLSCVRRNGARAAKCSSRSPCRKSWVVVLSPLIEVSTKALFAAPELTRHSESAKMAVFSEGSAVNDLQAVAAARLPEIASGLAALSRGARVGSADDWIGSERVRRFRLRTRRAASALEDAARHRRHR